MKKFIQTTVAVIAAFSFLAGSAIADDAINTICPIKGKEVDGSKSVDLTVKFCCEKCKANFDKDPLASAAKVAKAEDGKCPMSGKDVSDDQTSTVTIAVCCGSCEKKAAKNPAGCFAKVAKDKKKS